MKQFSIVISWYFHNASCRYTEHWKREWFAKIIARMNRIGEALFDLRSTIVPIINLLQYLVEKRNGKILFVLKSLCGLFSFTPHEITNDNIMHPLIYIKCNALFLVSRYLYFSFFIILILYEFLPMYCYMQSVTKMSAAISEVCSTYRNKQKRFM